MSESETMSASVEKKSPATLLTYLMKYGIPLVITCGLCYLLFTGIDVREMWHIIVTECDFRWIGAALCVSVLSHVARAARWGIQLRALGVKASLWTLTLSIFGTYAVNLVFPRLGEFWRTGWIAKKEEAPFATVFGSMVADRLTDTVTVILLTLFTFVLAGSQLMAYLQQNPDAWAGILAIVSSPWTWAGIAALTALAIYVFTRHRESAFVVKTKSLLKGLWEGFAVIVKMPGKGRWLLLTVAVWGCYFLQLYLAFFAFGLTAEVVAKYGATAVLVCFVLSSISMGVPSNGGIGPWQWAIIFGLSMYATDIPGLTTAYSTSFANLVMGCQTLLLIALGLFTFVCIALMRQRHAGKA